MNRWYLDEQRKNEIIKDLPITAEDFTHNSDVVPVSDPHIFAESQRYAQIQTLAARAQANPDLYDRLEVERRILKQIKLPDINVVLPDKKEVKDMNPALENVAMMLGKPVAAFPMQDHMAHFKTHLQFAVDPVFGGNPLVAPVFIPQCLEHLRQHLMMWYLTMTDGYTSAALGRPFNVLKVEPVLREAQQLIAAATQHVHQDGVEQLAAVAQAMQEMQGMLQKLTQQQQQQVDPNIAVQVQGLTQTAMAETQRKTAKDQADSQLKMAALQQKEQEIDRRIQTDIIMNSEDNLTEERIKSAELTKDAALLQHEQLKTVLSAQNEVQSQLGESNV